MNLADLLYETKNGQRRIKPQVVTSGIVLAVFLAFLFLLAQRQAAQSKKKANPFVTQRTFPERNLDYQIVKVDTLPFSHSTLPSEVTSSSSPFQKPAAQSPIAEPERSTRSAQREHLAPPPATTAAPRATGFNRSGSGDMIVVSSLERQPGRAGGGGDGAG